ncbi:MAG: c-type cytochrome [Acidobacteria bacterium]|nr:c-type cytochrome [Acidobacteriota bacterium]
MPDTPSPEKDPLVSKSLSGILLVSSLLLTITLFWALYDEAYGQRPWKSEQGRFIQRYTAFLKNKKIPEQVEREKQIRESAEFQALEQKLKDAEQTVTPQLEEIDNETRLLTVQVASLNTTFQEARGEISALTYQLEQASSEGGKQSLQQRIERVRQRTLRATLPVLDGAPAERKEFLFPELEDELNRMKARKAELQAKRIELTQPLNQLRQERDTYLREQLADLSVEQLNGLVRKMETFTSGIKQIHVADIDLVDRCESCHLGIREPIVLTAADMGGDHYAAAFVSHPKPELLKIHDPERFGCSPCHNGNGRATTAIEKAHGLNKHWLWPLYEAENREAGCQQCHTKDMYLGHATVLNEGKHLFDHRGCVGCHRYEGYDTEAEELLKVQQTISQKQQQKRDNLLEVDRSIAAADRAATNEEARELYDKADSLRISSSGLDGEIEQLSLRVRSLMRERKKVGPNLKEVRMKLNRDWVPVWLANPHAFRPTTRMPRFRLDEGQVRAIAAFVWQSGVAGPPPPSQPRGDAAQGKELFETRGCMACHSVGEGGQAVGGTFAANLSRVGEKANYDYLVRWIYNPRIRTRPYCPLEKRDLGPEDYSRHGLPFEFDLEHTTCPNDGAELQAEQMTVMPRLRLSWEEARNIATYLMTLKQQEAQDYASAPYLDDPAMKAQGQTLVRHFGCAGCHEIAGLEEEGRIGTELTKEGSKPIERLDFALLTIPAEREGWYTHKGFFTRKLHDPATFDQGKVKPVLEKLRMPNFDLQPEEITALSTFLMGSVESALPERYFYRPEQRGQDIQAGWKVVLKYNCVGCHQVRVAQKSVLSGLPRYQSPDWKEQLPPILVGEGARVDPLWLARFLENPAMSDTDLSRNGVRPYLRARMPTFYFSEGEILTLVRFFQAMASQEEPYVPSPIEPLSSQDLALARAIFTSPGAPCLECHATGNPAHDQRATAPNFVLMRTRLKPDWTRRWMLDPQMMSPGTAMPSGLFRQENGRWVFNAEIPPGFRQPGKDHADLLVRYIFQFTPEELRRISGGGGGESASLR